MNKRYDVYTPIEHGSITRWHLVGRGYLHKDGKGINVILDSLPLNGKLSIFPEGTDVPSE